jgi:hypothetical protein
MQRRPGQAQRSGAQIRDLTTGLGLAKIGNPDLAPQRYPASAFISA